MTMLQIIFYAFATVAIASGVMVVAAKNSVHGVLFLVLAFCAMSGIWLMLHAEFLALILVLVYVGAVMTLFLFVVMMLNLDLEKKREGFVRYFPFAAIVTLLVIGLSVMAIGPKRLGLAQVPAPTPYPADYSNVGDLGSVLYTNYAFPFEVAAVILLAAIIAAICLTHRTTLRRKTQNVAEQLAVKRDERVKLIDMPSERRDV